MKRVVVFIGILITSCNTTKIPVSKIICPDLDKIFPINKNNFANYLDFNIYDTLYYDSSSTIPKKTGRKIIGNIEILLQENTYSNYLSISQYDTVNKIYRNYEIQSDSLKNFHTTKYYNNKGFRIEESKSTLWGNINYEENYNICWKEAIAIAELNTVRLRQKKSFSHMYVGRSEHFQDPFWIFTVEMSDKKRYYFTVDGITGEFKKAQFEDIYFDVKN